TEYGRININSAPRPVLSALPGISDRQIDYLLYWRENTPRRDSLGGPIVFGRLSELLADNSFWTGQPQSVRLSVASRWIGAITFSSCAYTLTTENLPDPPSGPRLASRSKTQAIVSTDGGQDRVVSWRFAQ
ncbi:hypothetical protein FJY63_03115, partial [Candidatus Sumerlaeota bacterium]|nr:hypothetical protein [Candidatus Sumerlaeota bacterium]